MDSVLEEYKASLADLTFNSKPLINMLTVLAEENYSYAADIVRIIESQVYQSPPNQRLPTLYLIDSIIKSYGPYVKLFSTNLIKTFLFVFEKAETRVRQDLFKLRSTWNSMFSKSLLRDLDIAVQQYDRNWPIRAKKSAHSSGLTLDERVAAMMTDPVPSGPSRFSSDEEEYKASASYHEMDDDADGSPKLDYLVEEEEILLDEEKYDELEALEQALQKKKEELSKLESIDHTTEKTENVVKELTPPKETPPSEQTPYFLEVAGAREKTRIRSLSPSEDVEEPKMKRQKTNDEEDAISLPVPDFRRISQDKNDDQNNAASRIREIPQEKTEYSSLLEVGVKPPGIILKVDADTQTLRTELREAEAQISVDKQDQTTQYRYRKKTKNFLSQYRVPNKSVATYFRIKTKEAATQYSPPSEYQDTAADSTSGHLDTGRTDSVFGSKESSALKDYISALKDDFLPPGYSKHSGLVLRSLYAQRRQGLLCDITLGAEGRVFKAHKSVLAASSDFFYTLFASEEIEKTPLSHIELQGITAKALTLVLDYTYTSVLPIGSLSSIEEIITAAKRLQIHSLILTCPALEQALARKVDLAGWLISNSSLLSPSNRHPYVEAVKSLRSLSSSSYPLPGDNKLPDSMLGGGDGGTGDFICHVDRDMSRKKDPEAYGLPNSYEHYSNDDGIGISPVSSRIGKHKKKKHLKLKEEFYDEMSGSESDRDADKSMKRDGYSRKTGKFDAVGVVASPGMPPTSWSESNSPLKKKRSKDGESIAYKCMNCDRIISSKRNYISHCDAHLRRGEKPYKCKVCRKGFWKETVLESHLYKNHPDLSSSRVEKFISAKVLINTPSLHVFDSTPARKKGTPSPSSSSGKGKEQKRSKDLIRNKDNGPRPCPSCKSVLPNEVAYARHMRLNHPDIGVSSVEYQYQCNYCLQHFKTGGARAVHIKTHIKAGHTLHKSKMRRIKHADMEEEAGVNIADRSSGASSNEDGAPEVLRQEVNEPQDPDSAIKLKLYQCEICGEMFSIQCFYKAHMAGHKRNLDEF